MVLDEDYGRIAAFWFALDRIGQLGVGEVPPGFRGCVKRPACRSGQTPHATRRVDNLATHSPALTKQAWQRCLVKDTTRGELVWEYKAARVHLNDGSHPGANHNVHTPTDRKFWLIVMRQPKASGRRSQICVAQRRRRRVAADVDPRAVVAVAGRKVVRASQTGSRPGGIRSAKLHQPDPTLAVRANCDDVPGRADHPASGGKNRGSPSSRSPRPSRPWR